jgi:hypothetical protein
MNDWRSAESVADEALRITHVDRNKANGEPEENFSYIAQCWTALLDARGLLGSDEGLNAADVARMMVALKLCRDANAPHRDNRVDAIGYTLCLERVESTETVPKMTPILNPDGSFFVPPHVENPEDVYSVTFELKNAEVFCDEHPGWCSTCKYLKGGPTCRVCYPSPVIGAAPSHWEVGRTN